MRPIYLSLVIVAFYFLRADAQTCGTVAYDSEDGLGAGNYLDIFQDSRGILWVGSFGNGVNRFDGIHWENWTTATGMFANTVRIIYEDKEGGIWFNHNERGVSRYKDGKMQAFDFQIDTCVCGELYCDRQKNMFMIEGINCPPPQSTRVFEYDFSTKKFLPTEKRIVPENIAADYEYFWTWQGKKEDEWWVQAHSLTKQVTNYYKIQKGQPLKLEQSVSSKKGLIILFNPTLSSEAGTAIGYTEKGIFILNNKNWLPLLAPAIPRYMNDGITPQLEFKGCSLDPASNSLFAVWYLNENQYDKRFLLAEYNAAKLLLKRTILFSNPYLDLYSERQICKDAAGTIWINTFGNILRLFPDQFYIPITAPGMLSRPLGVAQAVDGNIWFTSYKDGLAGFDGLYLLPQPAGLKQNKFYAFGSLTDNKGNVYFNKSNPDFGILKFNEKNHWDVLANGRQGVFLNRDKKGQILWGTANHGLWILPKNKTGKDTLDWLKINRTKGLLLESVSTALEDYYGRYWVGNAEQGVAVYDPKTDKTVNWLRSQDPKNYGSMSMAEDTHGNLWFGTDRGLCFFENCPDISPDYDLQKNLLPVGIDFMGGSTVTSCMVYDERTLVIGNKEGLHLLDLDAFYSIPRRVLLRSLSSKNGYPAGPVGRNAMFIDNDSCIWLTAAKGVFRYDPYLLPRDTIIPQVFVDSIKMGNSIFKNFSERVSLTGGLQFLIYFHSPTNPMLFDNIQFEYKFTGNNEWLKILPGTKVITLQSPKAGTYRFEIRAVKEGIYSKPVVQLLNVPYWWQNPILWLVLGIILSIAIVLLLKVKLQKVHQNLQISKQQLQLEQSKAEMEKMVKEKNKLHVEAIVNQLNPHFINNTLQWIQLRVSEDEEAVRVVGKLSYNINAIFINTRLKRAYHSLQDELRLTENYLFIQKCRFKEKLDFLMPPEKALFHLNAVNVPLMIVQIHAENAVEHGIRNKASGKGIVQINLQEEEGYVVFTIEDNGIGRIAAKKIGSKSTQQGTKMLEELKTIYNKQNLLPIEQCYEDDIFVDNEGKLHGTRVIVRVPKNYNYEI